MFIIYIISFISIIKCVTVQPTVHPSILSSTKPSIYPSIVPSAKPSIYPSIEPTVKVTFHPTACQHNCSIGYFYDTDCSGCQTCPKGYACNGMCEPPIPCSKGTYQSSYGSGNCKPCDPGSFNTLEAQSSCQICPAGYECPEASMSKNRKISVIVFHHFKAK